MPKSKNKRKNGKVSKYRPYKRAKRFDDSTADLTSGVTLQDLINMVAYQEYQQAGIIDNVPIPDAPTVNDIDFENPDTQAVIRAVNSINVGDPDMVDGIGFTNSDKEQA